MIYSCKSEDDCCFPGDDTIFQFRVVDAEGADLLKTDTPGTYNTPAIKIFTIIDGEPVEINYQNSHAPKGYELIEYDSMMSIRPYFDVQEGKTMGFIKWNEHDQDSVELTAVHQGNRKTLVEIKYNGIKVWDETNSDDNRYFTVVK